MTKGTATRRLLLWVTSSFVLAILVDLAVVAVSARPPGDVAGAADVRVVLRPDLARLVLATLLVTGCAGLLARIRPVRRPGSTPDPRPAGATGPSAVAPPSPPDVALLRARIAWATRPGGTAAPLWEELVVLASDRLRRRQGVPGLADDRARNLLGAPAWAALTAPASGPVPLGEVERWVEGVERL